MLKCQVNERGITTENMTASHSHSLARKHKLHFQRRMSINVTNGLIYVRQLRQRTITLDWITGNCCLSTNILTFLSYHATKEKLGCKLGHPAPKTTVWLNAKGTVNIHQQAETMLRAVSALNAYHAACSICLGLFVLNLLRIFACTH